LRGYTALPTQKRKSRGSPRTSELLLLDEPTASLDPDTADWVRAYLEAHRLDRNCTILLASHNMVDVERLCDRVIMLKRGSRR
jgi:ABC-2 type transport system ATP-binding protein